MARHKSPISCAIHISECVVVQDLDEGLTLLSNVSEKLSQMSNRKNQPDSTLWTRGIGANLLQGAIIVLSHGN